MPEEDEGIGIRFVPPPEMWPKAETFTQQASPIATAVVPFNNDNRPGTWKGLHTAKGKRATVTCPQCGVVGTLEDHDIAADGVVSPSVVCDCGWHILLRLDGW